MRLTHTTHPVIRRSSARRRTTGTARRPSAPTTRRPAGRRDHIGPPGPTVPASPPMSAATPAAPCPDHAARHPVGASASASRRSPRTVTTVVARAGAIAIVCVLGVLLTAALAGAAPTHAVDPPAVPDLQLATSVQQVFDNIRNWLMGILAGLATIFLTLGGVRYLIGAGEPEEIAKAKTAFKAAAVGFALAALAPLVVTILESLVA